MSAAGSTKGWVHYRMDIAGVPADQFFAVLDLFRMNGTCIEEHWDVAQQRPINATNPLALF